MVEVLGVHGLGELHRVPGALDVGDLLLVGVGGDVVDRGEVEEVLDLPVQPVDVLRGYAEPVLGQVPDHRRRSRSSSTPSRSLSSSSRSSEPARHST